MGNLGEIYMRIFQNSENRFENFKPIFVNLHNRGHGVLKDNYYCISTSINIQSPNNKEELIFSSIQRDSMMKGVPFNCFYLYES